MPQEGLPKYAVELEGLDTPAQRDIFVRLGITDQTGEQLFRLLCEEAVDTRSPLVALEGLVERALRWAASPAHHRQQPRFPRAEAVLRERLVPFTERLVASGICTLEEEGQALRLHPLERVGELARLERLEALSLLLRDAWQAAADGPERAFPDTSLLDAEAQRLPRTRLNWKDFNQTLLTVEGAVLYELAFPAGRGAVLFTASLVLEVKRAATARFFGFIHDLVERTTEDLTNAALNRVNYMLRDSFPSIDPAHQVTLEGLYRNSQLSMAQFEGGYEVWAAVARKLMDEGERIKEESPRLASLRQSFALVFAWCSYARDLELKVKAGERVLLDLAAHIAAFPRHFSHGELVKRDSVREYVTRFGEAEFAALFTRFLRENNLRTPGVRPLESIIVLDAGGEPGYIHAARAGTFLARQLETARDRRVGLVAREFLFPWQALLRRDGYDERAATALRSEEAFSRELEAVFRKHYTALVSLLEFCGGVPDFLIGLCERGNIPLHQILNPEGTVKPPAALLKADRMRLLRQLARSVPLWQRLFMRVSRLFQRRTGERRSLWPLLFHALHGGAAAPEKKPAVSAEQTRSADPARSPGRSAGPSRPVRERPAAARERAAVPEADRPSRGKPSPREGRRAQAAGEPLTRKNSKALAAAFSGGHDKEWFTTRWGAAEGLKGEQARAFADRIIGERVAFALESVTAENLEEIAGHIAEDPRLGGFSNKEMLTKYVILSILERIK